MSKEIKVTPEIRTLYFDSTGIYSTDDVILAWYKRFINDKKSI